MFVQRIKIASSYLNLLIAQRLVESGRSNLTVHNHSTKLTARTLSGFEPGVDSSLVNAGRFKGKTFPD